MAIEPLAPLAALRKFKWRWESSSWTEAEKRRWAFADADADETVFETVDETSRVRADDFFDILKWVGEGGTGLEGVLLG